MFVNNAGARPITILSCCGSTKGRKIVTAKPYSLGSCEWWSDWAALWFIWPCLPCLCGNFLSYLKSSLHGFKICNSGYHKFITKHLCNQKHRISVTTNAVTSLLKNLQCHECPARAITGLVKEAFRVLRPGGTIALTDNSVGISFVLLFLRVQICNLVKTTDYHNSFFHSKILCSQNPKYFR